MYFVKGLQSCIETLIPQVEELLLNSWSNLHYDVTKLYTDNFTTPFPDYGNTTVLRWRGSLENSIFWPDTHSWCIHLRGKTSLEAWLWDKSRQLENGNYLYLNYEEQDYESPAPVFGPQLVSKKGSGFCADALSQLGYQQQLLKFVLLKGQIRLSSGFQLSSGKKAGYWKIWFFLLCLFLNTSINLKLIIYQTWVKLVYSKLITGNFEANVCRQWHIFYFLKQLDWKLKTAGLVK